MSPFAGVIFEGFVISEIIKAQHALGNEGEVYYFRDEQGLEVDIFLSPQAGRVVLAECKLSSTISPSMSASMRRLALALDKEKCRIDMRLIHTPSPTGRITSTAGEGVRACSTNEFIAEMFG